MSSFVLPTLDIMQQYIPSSVSQLSGKQSHDCQVLIKELTSLQILATEIPDETARAEFIRIYSSFMTVRSILPHPSITMMCFGYRTPNTQFIIPTHEIERPLGKCVYVNYINTTSTELFVLICTEFLKRNIQTHCMFTEKWEPLDIKTIHELADIADPRSCQSLINMLPGTLEDYKHFCPDLPYSW